MLKVNKGLRREIKNETFKCQEPKILIKKDKSIRLNKIYFFKKINRT